MKKMVLFACFLMWISPALAGAEPITAARFESKDFSDNETHRGVMYFGERMLRLDPEQQGDTHASVIFRGDRQHLIVLDHKSKTYFILDDKVIGQVGGQIDDMRAQMEAQLAQLPPRQREMARRMMEGRMPQAAAAPESEEIPRRIEATDETKTVNGYSSRLFEVFQGEEKVARVWATRDIDFQRLTGVFLELDRFSRKIRKSAHFANFQTGADFLGFEGLEGFPVLVETFQDGRLDQRISFTRIGASQEAVRFEPDPGYKPRNPGITN